MRRAEDLLDDAQDFLGAAKDLLATQRWAKVCFMAQQTADHGEAGQGGSGNGSQHVGSHGGDRA